MADFIIKNGLFLLALFVFGIGTAFLTGAFWDGYSYDNESHWLLGAGIILIVISGGLLWLLCF